jgi:low temperature requirement protein LtrA
LEKKPEIITGSCPTTLFLATCKCTSMELLSPATATILEIILIALLLFWIWCIVDVVRNKFEEQEKMTWLMVSIVLFVPGAILYLLFGRKHRIRD